MLKTIALTIAAGLTLGGPLLAEKAVTVDPKLPSYVKVAGVTGNLYYILHRYLQLAPPLPATRPAAPALPSTRRDG